MTEIKRDKPVVERSPVYSAMVPARDLFYAGKAPDGTALSGFVVASNDYYAVALAVPESAVTIEKNPSLWKTDMGKIEMQSGDPYRMWSAELAVEPDGRLRVTDKPIRSIVAKGCLNDVDINVGKMDELKGYATAVLNHDSMLRATCSEAAYADKASNAVDEATMHHLKTLMDAVENQHGHVKNPLEVTQRTAVYPDKVVKRGVSTDVMFESENGDYLVARALSESVHNDGHYRFSVDNSKDPVLIGLMDNGGPTLSAGRVVPAESLPLVLEKFARELTAGNPSAAYDTVMAADRLAIRSASMQQNFRQADLVVPARSDRPLPSYQGSEESESFYKPEMAL